MLGFTPIEASGNAHAQVWLWLERKKKVGDVRADGFTNVS